ncbi:MAG: hypothetical protein N4A35_05045 [Flavobacteriales bacterium]|jgi:hypothetical protein|nr:hypothetical protein [Flavobacteriales bacterium]
MKLSFSYIIIIFSTFFFSDCTLINYDYSKAPLTQEEKIHLSVSDSIQAILKKTHGANYFPYTFNQLEVDKPTAFITLDSLYNERKIIVQQKKKLKDSYDSLLSICNHKIEMQKEQINTLQVYHTYKMEHIYMVKSQENYVLYEQLFILFPNYQPKEIQTKLMTSLTNKERSLFDYFSLQSPLFETEDPVYNEQMDQIVYKRFNDALANETLHKEELLHTILYAVKYIRKYNRFNEEDIAKEMARRWLSKNNYSHIIPKYGKLIKTLKQHEINGYVLDVTDKRGQQKITFTFDLNLVIINTTIL